MAGHLSPIRRVSSLFLEIQELRREQEQRRLLATVASDAALQN